MPSKSKPIKVSDSSMAGLAAVITATSASLRKPGGSRRRKRALGGSGGPTDELFAQKNPGVEARIKRDKRARRAERKSKDTALHRKAALYDSLATQAGNDLDYAGNNPASSSGSDKAARAFLVDFKRKEPTTPPASAPAPARDAPGASCAGGSGRAQLDEFGRIPRPCADPTSDRSGGMHAGPVCANDRATLSSAGAGARAGAGVSVGAVRRRPPGRFEDPAEVASSFLDSMLPS